MHVCAFLAAFGVVANVATKPAFLPSPLFVFVPGALFAVIAIAAARMRARRTWLAPLYGAQHDRWKLVPIADARTSAGFACLGFSLESPQFFQYDDRTSPDRRSFEAIARGDGVFSTFRIHGRATSQGEIEIEPTIDEQDPEE